MYLLRTIYCINHPTRQWRMLCWRSHIARSLPLSQPSHRDRATPWHDVKIIKNNKSISLARSDGRVAEKLAGTTWNTNYSVLYSRCSALLVRIDETVWLQSTRCSKTSTGVEEDFCKNINNVYEPPIGFTAYFPEFLQRGCNSTIRTCISDTKHYT